MVAGRDGSVEARDRALLRSCIRTQIDHDFIDVAPPPSFGRIIPLDDGMAGRMEMGSCVLMRRLIAAADMPTDAADSQVEPGASNL